MKILHIITGLGSGGAESNLYKICINDKINQHYVISLMDMGIYGKLLKKKNINVKYLDLKNNFFSIIKILKLIALIKKINPDIIQTWMYHADLIGSLAGVIIGNKKIVWNIRHSDFDNSKLLTIFLVKILGLLSWLIPNKIIVCSKKAIEIHCKIGYSKKKMIYVPNGYDLNVYKYIQPKYHTIRKKFKIKSKVPLIGTVARYHPQKDHKLLLNTLSVLKKKKIDFFCILAGPNINTKNKALTSIIHKLGLLKNIKLLDNVKNISKIMSEIDIHILASSHGEGFPNVVAEAMACRSPCIVTNVGDSSIIVGKTGWVVPPKNVKKLANVTLKAIKEIKTKKWKKRSYNARLRIKNNFNIYKMVKNYNRIWKSVI